MAKLTITIDTSNAAFDPHPRFEIIATLLDFVARIEHDIIRLDTLGALTLYDTNGNTCGSVAYTADASDTTDSKDDQTS